MVLADHGDGRLVSFEARTGSGNWVAQEIEVFGGRAQADGDVVLA
jgi:hypothetical protein